jgi:ElaB/YqjD/DUF883 family membrane-anchored ribosome-binding protein
MTAKQKSYDTELDASRKAALEAFDKLLEARKHFTMAAEAAGLDLKDEAVEQLARGRVKAQELGEVANEYMRDKPLHTLGIAFLAGYVLAQMSSRK